jgi:Icc-related predicted phosphoesterase
MSRHFGLSPTVKAKHQLQRKHLAVAPPQPLPAGSPGRATAAAVGITDASPLTFLLAGDVGGVSNPTPQLNVAKALEARATQDPKPAFLYLVGDIVYFYGDEVQYGAQFYEPYTYLQLPIVAIPGNHDGDTSDDPTRAPLDAFMANFCAGSASLPPTYAEYGRDVQTQPYCDWTLQLGEVTIIGLYDNVPDGGYLYDSQTQWLVGELQAAPASVPVIVTTHHPPYSVDAFHGGSVTLGDALDAAFTAAGRTPQLVITGHVHDYQRYTRTLGSETITYVVSGNGGYHNLHKFAPDVSAGEEVAPGVTFESGDDQRWGFLELTVAAGAITGSYTAVDATGAVTAAVDTFTL